MNPPLMIPVSAAPWERAVPLSPLLPLSVARPRELALRLFISLHGAYVSFTRRHSHESPTPMGGAVHTCLNEMKRSLGIACVLLLLVAAISARAWLRARRGRISAMAMKQEEEVAA